MQVTAQPESAFADLAAEDSDFEESHAAPKPSRKKAFPWLLVGSILALVPFAVVAGVVVIKITNKDGTVTEIKVPEGAKIEVDGKTVASEPKKSDPHPKAPADPDRRAAGYVLSLGGTVRVSGQGSEIKAASELPKGAFQLTGVVLTGHKTLTDAGLANFKDCQNLTYLGLTDSKMTETGLSYFKDCKNLSALYLNGSSATDAGLAHFKDCKNLTVISLNGAPVTDEGLAHFKDCKNLTVLHLNGLPVTDSGLACFKECRNLKQLGLRGTKVTDAGLADFQGCKNLTQLHLQKSKVTTAGIGEMKKAFPKCRIESDHGTHEPK